MEFSNTKTVTSVIGLACLLSVLRVDAAPTLSKIPLQTFYVPMKETELFYDMFKRINLHVAEPPVETMLAVAISDDDTIIWYDHWEDGYDKVVDVTGNTTEIWGDGDASNGCPPDVDSCTDANDKLKAGDNVVIQNTVYIEDADYGKTIVYDGGDRMVASSPITITRGAYPSDPGSLMAGGVEVHDIGSWGTEYEAPVGVDIGQYFAAFQFSSFFFMAANDNTEVTLPNGSIITLNRGESGSVSVSQCDKLISTKPIQVNFITGDEMSFYELRWFTLLPTSSWSNSYVTPVGDTVGKTKMLVYNPSRTTIFVDYTYLQNGMEVTERSKVKRGKATLTSVIPSDSGSIIESVGGEIFIALSFTDTEYRTSVGQITAGQWYDWGFPVTPTNLLTPQVLVGWGYGCTNNNCYGFEDRSVIWVTPVADADIYIDYDNSGDNFALFPRKKLTSSKFVDQDNDMSGAFIFATEPGSGPNGAGVPIAAAWGQDPAVSRSIQSISLDLGTVVLPFPSLRAAKHADKPEVRFGDILTYTIKVMSAGYGPIRANDIKVFDELDPMVTYVPGSASYVHQDGSSLVETTISDDVSGTPFPFDAEGFTIPVELDGRGDSLDIVFSVTVDGNMASNEIQNSGYAEAGDGSTAPFIELTTIVYEPVIDINNTVYSGADEGALCGSNSTLENVEDITGADVTYCFVVTNTGNTPLGDITVVNGDLSYTDSSIGTLAPGETTILYLSGEITDDLMNTATVSGTPLYPDESPIAGMSNVESNDTSSVTALAATPSIVISNTVYLGSDNGEQCASAVEYVEAADGTSVVYCFNVTNTGNTHLSNVTVSNDDLAIGSKPVGDLAPGDSKTIFVTSSIPSIAHQNVATTSGNPTFSSGKDMSGVDDVTASDDSSVGVVKPDLSITNTVYLGDDLGASCPGEELIQGDDGDSLVYCFNVTNTGDTALDVTMVSNLDLNFTDDTIGVLQPGESKLVAMSAVLNGNLTNTVTATANPLMDDGSDFDGFTDVTASDPSAVIGIPLAPVFDDGDTRSGLRDPYQPPNDPVSGNCLHESYADDGNNPDDLVCTTQDVYVNALAATEHTTCELGETITVSISGSIFLSAGVFDLGWYVGTDAGDALEGTCAVNGLQKDYLYSVVDAPGSTTEIGSVTWEDNSCGDVTIPSGGGGFIDTPITVKLPVVCSDENEDGEMDVSVCFTWRTEENKAACTIDTEDPLTQGSLADLYPGSSNGCFCERYDVPNISVEKPPVAPC